MRTAKAIASRLWFFPPRPFKVCCSGEDEGDLAARSERYSRLAKELTNKYLNELESAEESEQGGAAAAQVEKLGRELRRAQEDARRDMDEIRDMLGEMMARRDR